jgi:hypothetical protein
MQLDLQHYRSWRRSVCCTVRSASGMVEPGRGSIVSPSLGTVMAANAFRRSMQVW